MEYTRFPGAADEPPRADALRGSSIVNSRNDTKSHRFHYTMEVPTTELPNTN